jgi:hypothetical protein
VIVLICNRCGHQISELARFCTNCGSKRQTDDLLLAVQLKTGVIQRTPSILWLSANDCALLHISLQFYQNIISETWQRPANQINEKQKAQAFRDYAAGLAAKGFPKFISANPQCQKFHNSQIVSMTIVTTYDSEANRYDPYERFILQTISERFRGAFEFDTALSEIEPYLKLWLGQRYARKTMSGYPFV